MRHLPLPMLLQCVIEGCAITGLLCAMQLVQSGEKER